MGVDWGAPVRIWWDDMVDKCRSHVHGGPVVYFVLSPRTGLIKIGKAVVLRERMRQLRDSSPEVLELVKTLPGYTEEETWAHYLFRDSRERGEWFRYSEIADAVASLQELGKRTTKFEYWGWESVQVVSSVCGHTKDTTRKNAKKVRNTPCMSCSQKARFADQSPEERRAAIAGAKRREKSWREANAGRKLSSTIEKYASLICPKCGGPLISDPSSIRKSYKPKTCVACRRSPHARDEVGNLYGELRVTKEADRDARGGIVLELVCSRGHVTRKAATALRHRSKHNTAIICTQCPHDAEYWSQWNTLECNTKK